MNRPESSTIIGEGFSLEVHDLGRMPYAEAYDLQRALHAEVVASREPDRDARRQARRFDLLLVEHDPPVITVSKRATAAAHLIATHEQLRDAGVEVAETDRGGDITYHGPGQLVVYPILDLNAFGLRLHGYMRLLEQVVIDTLAQFGIEGVRDPAATGVWVESSNHRIVETSNSDEARLRAGSSMRAGPSSAPAPPAPHNAPARASAPPPAKICAMGVRVSKWVSMHGLALNVSTNLDHFNLIIPCGLVGRTVTSMQAELGEACPTMDAVKRTIVECFTTVFTTRNS